MMERKIHHELRAALSKQGYIVKGAQSVEDALDQLGSLNPDIILLDLREPEATGIETCRLIRSTCEKTILILLTGKVDEEKIAALDAGADDFVTKPLCMPELLARIRARLRRMNISGRDDQILSFGNVEINLTTREVTVGGEPKHLTPKQFELLSYLVTNRNTVIPHINMLQAVWGSNCQNHVHYLHMFIMQIRKIIEPDHTNPRYLLTEPCIGYRFNLPIGRSRRVTVLIA